MSYLGSKAIDDTLTFYVNTTRFDTGAATDADAAPAYRVYEDETGTALLNGTMALLDSVNTAGLYSEQITLSAANGFEAGKDYVVYVAATVNSVAGATNHTFQIGAKVNTTHISGTAQTANDNGADINAILLDTNELQTDWADGGRLDLILDARSSQTSVDDLPTNAELTTALGTADDAVLAAIAALNDFNPASDEVIVGTNNDKTGYALSATGSAQLTEDYAADGAAPTLNQALYMILQNLTEFSISGTTITVNKLDKSTAAATYTLDDDTTPSSRTRAT